MAIDFNVDSDDAKEIGDNSKQIDDNFQLEARYAYTDPHGQNRDDYFCLTSLNLNAFPHLTKPSQEMSMPW